MKQDVLGPEICEACGRSFRYPVKRKGPPRRGGGDNRKLPNWTRKVLPGGSKAYLRDGASEPLEVRRSPGEETGKYSVGTMSKGDTEMTYNVIFAKHFDEAGLGIDYPTDFLQVAEGVIEDCTFIEMRPPTNNRLEDHGDCEAFYCSRCKSRFSIAEINPSSASCRPPCPHCRVEIASEDESGTELEAIRMQSAELHIEECKAGLGEEEWQYEVADQDAGYFDSALDRCQTVVRYRARPQTPWSGWAGQMNGPPDARG